MKGSGYLLHSVNLAGSLETHRKVIMLPGANLPEVSRFQKPFYHVRTVHGKMFGEM